MARTTQRRNPRGLSEKDGRPQIYLVKGDARVYKDVPLPVEFDFCPSILGVVLR